MVIGSFWIVYDWKMLKWIVDPQIKIPSEHLRHFKKCFDKVNGYQK